ncbi:MAG TPA: BON domain-containing protein [Terriglobia bacterium]|nr:BON domain-containing protein [Terriglobia bacterium]
MRKANLFVFSLLLAVAAPALFGQKPATTAEIAAHVQSRLYHARVFEHGEVQVAFENGVATLTGTVDSLGVKLDAERAARKVDEVMKVENNINVHAEDVTARQIAEQARKEIVTYYAYGIFDNIWLEAEGDKLIVNGQVGQPFKKEDIGNFLAHIKGVAVLENNLEVLPLSSYDDSLRIAVARAIYNDPFFIRYANQPNPPIHIIVKNGNVTLEGVVATQLDRAKAETAARFASTFLGLTNNLRVEGN